MNFLLNNVNSLEQSLIEGYHGNLHKNENWLKGRSRILQ